MSKSRKNLSNTLIAYDRDLHLNYIVMQSRPLLYNKKQNLTHYISMIRNLVACVFYIVVLNLINSQVLLVKLNCSLLSVHFLKCQRLSFEHQGACQHKNICILELLARDL